MMRALKSQEEIHQVLLGHLEQMRISQDIQEQLLRMLVSSIDFRSHYTALHCAVMVRVSDLLAQLCGLEKEERRQVHLGAILHDLGKIAIPSEILESPGKAGRTGLGDYENSCVDYRSYFKRPCGRRGASDEQFATMKLLMDRDILTELEKRG